MVAAAADEQPLRGEDRSRVQEGAYRAASEFGAAARGGGYPSEQAGPSNPRPVGDARVGGGEEGAGLPPIRKRRRDASAGGGGGSVVQMGPSFAAVAQLATSSGVPTDHRKKKEGATPASESRSTGLLALQRLGSIYMARPRGPTGKGGPLSKDDRAVESFRQIEESFHRLYDLAEGKQAMKRIQELEQQLDSLRREIGDVRLDLLRTRGARGGRGSGVASLAPRAASLAGRPEARVSAPKVAQRGEWVRVGRGGKPQRQEGQRVQLLRGAVNPPPGLVPAASSRQGGAAKGGPPERQGGHALSGAPNRRKAAVAVGQQQSKRAGRPRLPRNPAVLLTAVGERSYASLLSEAQERVDLADIGIDVGAAGGGLLIKRARNGGYLFEVPGEGGAAKADRLARELGEVLVGGAKVARPVKFAEVRLTGLVDGITPDTVVAAFKRCGECSQDDLVAGEIRRAPGGLGTMWLRCPLAAAMRVEARKGLRLGWAHVGVQLLEARPLQCYRCLRFGHLAAACTGPTDRKGRCFRCGGDGHVARGCNADPRCILCEKAGLDPVHRLGGRACPAARAAWAKQRGVQPDAVRPAGAPGRRRGGCKAKGRATPAPAGGAVGPGAVFRAPEHPAPRASRKEEGAAARAPEALERAAVPLPEADGAEPGDVDVVSCAQPLSGCEENLARMEIVGEEEEPADSSSYLLECGLDEWLDSPPSGGV